MATWRGCAERLHCFSSLPINRHSPPFPSPCSARLCAAVLRAPAEGGPRAHGLHLRPRVWLQARGLRWVQRGQGRRCMCMPAALPSKILFVRSSVHGTHCGFAAGAVSRYAPSLALPLALPLSQPVHPHGHLLPVLLVWRHPNPGWADRLQAGAPVQCRIACPMQCLVSRGGACLWSAVGLSTHGVVTMPTHA